MHLIKVNAIPSTNDFVKEYYRDHLKFEPVCVQALHQTKGKGQKGGSWHVPAGKNLTFSLLYPQVNLNVMDCFLLNAITSLAVINVLQRFNIPKLKVKWPNDIMSENYKICGILIENYLKSATIVASVIGIGLNVNQEDFGDLNQASSLKLQTGQNFNLDEILDLILKELENHLKNLSTRKPLEILDNYAEIMFKKDIVSTFQWPEGGYFSGIIRGVTKDGLLSVEVEDEQLKSFDLKEVKLMY